MGCLRCVKFGPSNGSSMINAEIHPGKENSLWPISKSNTNILFHFLRHLLRKYCIITDFPAFLYPANKTLNDSNKIFSYNFLVF